MGVIVRSNSFSNAIPLLAVRQSWGFRRNLFHFDVADLLELLLRSLPAGLPISILRYKIEL